MLRTKPIHADGELKEISLSQLKGNEVMIEGTVYDLRGFKHPGGDIVHFFGGNDVSVQYRMIHPHHTDDRFLAKLKRVGKVNYCPQYSFNTPFEQELKKEVFKIVRRGNEFGTKMFFVRVAFYIALLAFCMFSWVYFGSSIPLAILFGISQALIGLNVQHDANHGAASKKYPWINDLLGFGADLIGGSKYTWLEQHWTHHAFTNHTEYDPDSFSAEPLMLFNDYPLGHPARKWFHRAQVIFFLPILSFYWLSSVFNTQIIGLQHGGTKKFMNWSNDYIKGCRYSGWLLRLVYIVCTVYSPFVHHDVWTAIFHIWIFSTVESLMLSTLFSLSHNFETVDRNPTKVFEKTREPVCWAKSQVETSSTYGGFLSGYLTGGLNFQIEHHLFPRMSSAWYPYIAPTVRAVCAKHNVNYVYYPWIHQNFIATLLYMHRSGNGSHWEMDPLSGK